jgi:hypothetical protein
MQNARRFDLCLGLLSSILIRHSSFTTVPPRQPAHSLLSRAVRSQWLNEITRVVVKLGTGILTDSRKQPDLSQLEQLVTQIAEQRKSGKEMLVVSSGAVGAGMGVLGFEKRPRDLAELQACAAVGQSR